MKVFKYRFKATLRYILISLALMFFIDLMANYKIASYITYIFAGIFGFFVGSYRAFFDFRLIRTWSIIPRLFLQLLIAQVFIMLAILVSRDVLTNFDVMLRDDSLIVLLTSKEYMDVYIKAQVFAFILFFFIELETLLGKKFMVNYLLGKYHKPLVEHRIMLFLDLNDSTAIAERLGDREYFKFLNYCYQLLDKPVMITDAEILKYVGDEVVISWDLKRRGNSDVALEFYKAYQEAVNNESEYFIKTFQCVPKFTTGIHQGEVVAAVLGDIKKQLDLSGDLMNTTSRICGACKDYNAELMVSDEFYNSLDSEKLKSKASSVGKVKLKGKVEDMELFKFNF